MCGIHGFTWSDQAQIERMVELSHKRGPDANSSYKDIHISLGHNLLAITESPAVSTQPWEMYDKNVLCYNGEIYNYKELKEEIESKYQHKFQTDSDTEVVAYGLFFQGIEFIKKLDGMYAIAWYDREKRTITLARDCSGVKPLYYNKGERGLSFSSSIKSLLSLGLDTKLDHTAFAIYTNLGYVPGPKTLISSIKKLIPGEVITYDIRSEEYTSNFCVTPNFSSSQADFVASEFREAVSDSVKKCLMGRRPIGLFLSGGLDSSMILHELVNYDNKPKTFTTRFDCKDKDSQDRFNNDADIALKLSKEYNTDHTDFVVTLSSFLDAVEPCIEALEEPRFNKNTPAYYLLNQELARQGIVVTLSGDGGDEIFTGYKHHKFVRPQGGAPNYLNQWYNLTKFKKAIPFNGGGVSSNSVANYMTKWFPCSSMSRDHMNNHLFVETLTHLPEDYLIRNDKLGMNFSMEGRFPLTLKSFKEYILSINSSKKMSLKEEGLTKPFKLLPKKAYKGHLPDYVIDKMKTGWSIPTTEWLSSEKFRGEFLDPALRKGYHEGTDDLFNFSSIKGMKPEMTIFYFRVWAKKYGIVL